MKSWTFRLTSQGVEELKRDLEALGERGKRVFDGLINSAPGLAQGLGKAEQATARARRELEELNRKGSPSMKALSAAGGEVGERMQGLASRVPIVGAAVSALGPAGIAAAAGIGLVAVAANKVADGFKAWAEAERSIKRLDQVVRASGEGIGLTRRELAALATQVKSNSFFGDNEIRAAQAALALNKDVRGDAFKDAIRLASDLSEVLGGDLVSNAIKLGRAYRDPIKGLEQLRKAGIEFEDGAEASIRAMVKAGNAAGASARFFEELDRSIGGSAAAAHGGAAGAIDRLQKAAGDAEEALGRLVADRGVIEFYEYVTRLADKFNESLSNTGPTVDQQIETIKSKLAELRTQESQLPGAQASANSPLFARLFNEGPGQIPRLEEQLIGLGEAKRFERTLGIQQQNAAIAGAQAAAERERVAAAEALAQAEEEVLSRLQDQVDATQQGRRERFIAQEVEKGIAALIKEQNALGVEGEAVSEEAVERMKRLAGALYDAQEAITKGEERARKEQEAAGRRVADFSRDLSALKDAIDPTGAALRKLAEDQALLDKAWERGFLLGEEYDDLVVKLRIHFEEVLDPIGKALTKLNEAQDEQAANLSAEAAAMGMSAQQRAIYLAGIKAENELKKEGVPLSDARAQSYIEEAKALAAQKNRLDAMQANQQVFENFIDQSWDRIGSAITGALATGEIQFVRLLDVGRAVGSQLLQFFSQLGAINPIKNWITGSNLPTLGSVLGSVGGGVQTASGGIGSGSSGFGGLQLGGAGLGDIFGAIVGRNALFTPVKTIGSAGAAVGGAPTALGNFASFLNTPFGGGLGGGLLGFATSLLSGQGLAQSAITGGLTGIGTAVGSIFGLGPIGGVVGGLLGSLVGGLLKKKPKLKKYEAEAFIEANPFGLPVLDVEHESGKLGNLGNDLAKLARGSIEDLLGSAGALMPDDVRARLSYYHSTKGGKTKTEFYKASLYDTGIKGLSGEIGRYQDAETAAQALAAGTLFMAGLTGDIQGTGASTGQAFQNLWKQAGRKVGNIGQYDAEMLTETISFTKWLDGLDQVRSESDAAAKALLDLNAQLNKLNSQAEDLGLETGKVLDAMKRDFAASIGDELLQLTDPQAFALRALEQEYAGRKAVAEKLGLDLVELEKLYALKRQQILDQGLQGIASTWTDFINQLQFGELSGVTPTDQLANARAQYEASKEAGGAEFREAAMQYLALQEQFFGSTKPYVDLFEEVIALAKQFGGIAGIPGYASGIDWHPGGLAVVGERGREVVSLPMGSSVTANDRTEALLRALSANDNGGRAMGASPRVAVQSSQSEMAALRQTLSAGLQQLAQQQQRNGNELRLVLEAIRQRA